MRTRITFALFTLPLVLCWTGVALGQSPQQQLFGVLLPEFTEPQLACEWQAAHFDDIDRKLSLYREELRKMLVHVDGVALSGGVNDAVARVIFESRLLGPNTAALTVNVARLNRRASLTSGRRLEISFADASGKNHPLFCGYIARVIPATSSKHITVIALQPRAGNELHISRQFLEMRRHDVISEIAAGHNLTTVIQDSASREVQEGVRQNSISDWFFMRHLAAADNMDFYFRSDGKLLSRKSPFTPPVTAIKNRGWVEMKWVDVIATIIDKLGRQADIEETTEDFPVTNFKQTAAADEVFMHELAADHERSAFFVPGKVRVRDDGQWRKNPNKRTARMIRVQPTGLAQTLARRYRIPIDVPRGKDRTVSVTQRNQTDAEFLYTVLARNRYRLSQNKGRLVLRQSVAPGDVTDLLTKRIVIEVTGSSGRRFTRQHGNVRNQILNPDGVAVTEVRLELGQGGKSPATVGITLADTTVIARNLDTAIASVLADAGSDAVKGFQANLARVYRPALIHLYRLVSDGQRQLEDFSEMR